MKPKATFCICGNAETLCMGTLANSSEDAAIEATDAAFRVLTDAGIDPADIEVDSNFSAWNGGRHWQFREACGFVSVHKDASKDTQALAYEANAAIEAVLIDHAKQENADALSWLKECYEKRERDPDGWRAAYEKCEEFGIEDDEIRAYDPDAEYRV